MSKQTSHIIGQGDMLVKNGHRVWWVIFYKKLRIQKIKDHGYTKMGRIFKYTSYK